MLTVSRGVLFNWPNNLLKNHARISVPLCIEFNNSQYDFVAIRNKTSAPRNSIQSRNFAAEAQKPKPATLSEKKLRFPVLPLEQTIQKFLKTAEPLVTNKELEEAKKNADEFMKTEGAQLQKLLQQVGEKEENWLANRWQRGAYFQYRDPVTVFSSPGMTFPIRKFYSENDYLDYTSKVIYGLLKYKELIDNDKIPVMRMGKFELDNSQFKRVFGTCRLPRLKEDSIEYNPDSKHVIVMHKNNIYKFPVYDGEGKILPVKSITKELSGIMTAASTIGTPFGVLTTDHRDNWARAYDELERSFETAPPLKEIQKGLFIVALDEYVEMPMGQELNIQSGQLIHGGGSRLNAGNRWMDKTIQLVVNPNGISGFTYEHSPAEGQPIASICDYVIDNLDNEQFYDSEAACDYEKPMLLKLKTTPCIDSYIQKAKENVDRLAQDLEMNVFVYSGYGKQFIKSKKLSPDSFIQTALQYAFYEMYNEAGACYETAHLRIYPGGRTETIRSCTTEAIQFAKGMRNKKFTETGAAALRNAVEAHRQYTTQALQGRGVDRHFFGLKMMAIENNLPLPDFFKSAAYVKSSHFRLSTSQVASNHKAFMCYGPLTDDGYGCCYNPRDSSMIFAISAWRNDKSTHPGLFAKALSGALDEMRLLLECGDKTCSKL